jgi:hypothetical protein
MLIAALLQAATSSLVLAAAFTLALHPDDHAHSVTIVAHGGHHDLVLTHADDGGAADAHPRLNGSFSPRDHLVALDDHDRGTSISRRAEPERIAVVSAIEIVPAPAIALLPRSYLLAADGARTVRPIVLRL